MARSTQIVKAGNKLPAAIQAQYAQELAEFQDRIQSTGGDKISIKRNKTFSLPEGGEVEEITGIIVDFASANTYYTMPYTEGQIIPPDCFALSFTIKGMAPSKNSPDKQANTCAECEKNQFGSASNGRGKACDNNRILAILPTDASVETPLAILKVSPTALKSFDGHASNVFRINGTPVRGVVTRISFSKETDYPSLRFETERPCTPEEVIMVNGRLEEAKKRLLTEPKYEASAPQQSPRTTKKPTARK